MVMTLPLAMASWTPVVGRLLLQGIQAKENNYGNGVKACIAKKAVYPVSLMSENRAVGLRAIEQNLIIPAD